MNNNQSNAIYFKSLLNEHFYDGANDGLGLNISNADNNTMKRFCPHLSYRIYKNISNVLSTTYLNSTYYIGTFDNKHYFFYKNRNHAYDSSTLTGQIHGNIYVYDDNDNFYIYNISTGSIQNFNTSEYYDTYMGLSRAMGRQSGVIKDNDCVFNTSIYQELQYYPNDYLPGLLYISIPLLVFLLAIKVLKKGLFK